jgi:hypothetical protein
MDYHLDRKNIHSFSILRFIIYQLSAHIFKDAIPIVGSSAFVVLIASPCQDADTKNGKEKREN